MKHTRRNTLVAGAVLAATVYLLSGCNETASVAEAANPPAHLPVATSHSMASGTPLDIALSGTVSSATASVGDAWHGTLTENVSTPNGGTIPAGSPVSGVVTGAAGAVRGSRAMLELAVRSIRVNGHDTAVHASSEPVVAGSTRARNLGAIAGSAVAGALIGKAVGDGKNAAAGGVIGAAAATGVVATSKGYQVILADGTVMRFTVSETVALR
jgi:hypothetical protein